MTYVIPHFPGVLLSAHLGEIQSAAAARLEQVGDVHHMRWDTDGALEDLHRLGKTADAVTTGPSAMAASRAFSVGTIMP